LDRQREFIELMKIEMSIVPVNNNWWSWCWFKCKRSVRVLLVFSWFFSYSNFLECNMKFVWTFFGMFIGYFAEKLNVDSAFKAKLYCTIRTIKLAYQKNCWNLPLKTDSTLVILAFKFSTIGV
jgi:hypothetical protein